MMRCTALIIAVLVACVDSASLRLQERAHRAGVLLGENKAAKIFLKEVSGLPKKLSDDKQKKVIDALEAEVSKLGENVKHIKDFQKKERTNQKQKGELKKEMKGKDAEMMDNFDQWSNRMDEKAKVGAIDVMSKLKNAIHLIKKGALSGNGDASKGLENVMKQMSEMTR